MASDRQEARSAAHRCDIVSAGGGGFGVVCRDCGPLDHIGATARREIAEQFASEHEEAHKEARACECDAPRCEREGCQDKPTPSATTTEGDTIRAALQGAMVGEWGRENALAAFPRADEPRLSCLATSTPNGDWWSTAACRDRCVGAATQTLEARSPVEASMDRREMTAATTEARKRIYMVKRTLVERCFYDPDEIRREFGEPDNGESWEDFVVRVFERFDGSIYGDEFFPGDASPEVGTELEERWDDE